MTDTTSTASGPSPEMPVVAFRPPGPGRWELETTHHGLRPLSPFIAEAYRRAFESGTAELVERYGLPLERVCGALVEGCFYVRPLGLGERRDATPTAPPPLALLRVLARVHPGMRRRSRAAAAAFSERRWRSEVDRWFEQDRAPLVTRNLELQAADLTAMGDADLVDHVDELAAHHEAGMRRNLATHGGDLIPIGDLVAHCEHWGIAPGEAADLLTGASDATTETTRLLAPVADAVASAPEGWSPALDELRSVDPAVAVAIDEWAALHAWRLVMSDDIDRPTLAELPELQRAALLAAAQPPRSDTERWRGHSDAIRSRVPVGDRPLFDQLVEEARYGARQRDDIRGVCWNWPGGLLRRALLEVGRRLSDAGRLDDPDHVVELLPAELAPLLLSGDGPTAEQLSARSARRDLVEAAPPPRTLGDPEPEPPLAALPAPMARATAALMANLAADATPAAAGPTAPASGIAVSGHGIGTTRAIGRACVVTRLDELDRLQDGDVLVARFTGPSFNSAVPLLAALVVEEGGAICHAAIVAREFGLPTIVGAAGATTLVPDGATIEVDPVAGCVRLH